MPANAGVLRCDYRTMVKADYAALKSAATRTAAPHLLDWHGFSPCMNPGSGRAWIDARPEPQPDGSRLDFRATCERDIGPWKCELEVNRHYEFALPLNGHERKFDFVIPEHLAVAEARALVARALEKAPTLRQVEGCGAKPDDPPDAWYSNARKELVEALASGESPITGSIQEDADSTEVFLSDDIGFRYSRIPDAASEKTFQCWATYVVVD